MGASPHGFKPEAGGSAPPKGLPPPTVSVPSPAPLVSRSSFIMSLDVSRVLRKTLLSGGVFKYACAQAISMVSGATKRRIIEGIRRSAEIDALRLTPKPVTAALGGLNSVLYQVGQPLSSFAVGDDVIGSEQKTGKALTRYQTVFAGIIETQPSDDHVKIQFKDRLLHGTYDFVLGTSTEDSRFIPRSVGPILVVQSADTKALPYSRGKEYLDDIREALGFERVGG